MQHRLRETEQLWECQATSKLGDVAAAGFSNCRDVKRYYVSKMVVLTCVRNNFAGFKSFPRVDINHSGSRAHNSQLL